MPVVIDERRKRNMKENVVVTVGGNPIFVGSVIYDKRYLLASSIIDRSIWLKSSRLLVRVNNREVSVVRITEKIITS